MPSLKSATKFCQKLTNGYLEINKMMLLLLEIMSTYFEGRYLWAHVLDIISARYSCQCSGKMHIFLKNALHAHFCGFMRFHAMFLHEMHVCRFLFNISNIIDNAKS